MNKKQIRFIVFRYNHHSPHSGYSRLAEYGSNYFHGDVIRVGKPLSRFLIRDRILWKISEGTPGYDRASMAAELNVAWRMVKERDSIYHFLYGETTYHYSGWFKDLKQNQIVATFHLPPEGIRKAVQIDWHLHKLSAVICVGTTQQNYFRDYIASNRIFFVPLGVDTDYYTPPERFETRDPNLCLIVGENYRDYPTLRGVIELVAYIRPQTQFVAVTSPNKFDLIGHHPNLKMVSRIPESEFIALYRKASLLVMPLSNATANNAVLESMACGLPMVISDVGSIRDYVGEDCGAFIQYQNARAMAESIVDLLSAPKELEKMSINCRKQAEKFSWMNVMEQLASVYKTIG